MQQQAYVMAKTEIGNSLLPLESAIKILYLARANKAAGFLSEMLDKLKLMHEELSRALGEGP